MISKVKISGVLQSVFPLRQSRNTAEAALQHPRVQGFGRQVVLMSGVSYPAEQQAIPELDPSTPYLHRMHRDELHHLLMSTVTDLTTARRAGRTHFGELRLDDIHQHLIGCFDTLNQAVADGQSFVSFNDLQASNNPEIIAVTNGAFDHAYHRRETEHHGIVASLAVSAA